MMNAQSQSEQNMSYTHIPLPDRRDSLDNASSLNQALGPHLANVGQSVSYQGNDRLSRISPLVQNGGPSQGHGPPSNSHSPMMQFAVSPHTQDSAMKRKQAEGMMVGQLPKRRREGEEVEMFDSEGNAPGAKHWTDDEKTKLFNWLMGPGQDEHWNSLRATKNSCLRECAMDVFNGKKTYQALKGCYERNFNLFKQIFAFEAYHAQIGSPAITALAEADRLREYERRLQTAKKAGCDVGNITARAVDHWHRAGWYSLFYRRWNGDPATTRPNPARQSFPGATSAGEEDDVNDDPVIDFHESASMNGINGHLSDYGQPPPFSIHKPREMPAASASTAASPITAGSSTQSTTHTQSSQPSDQSLVNISLTQGMVTMLSQYLQTESHNSKLKLDFMRRREEREEQDSKQRREVERLKHERETAEWEQNRVHTKMKHRAELALELIANREADQTLKDTAVNYLKGLFVD